MNRNKVDVETAVMMAIGNASPSTIEDVIEVVEETWDLSWYKSNESLAESILHSLRGMVRDRQLYIESVYDLTNLGYL